MKTLEEITQEITAKAISRQEVRDCTNLLDKTGFRQGDVYIIKFDSPESLNEIFSNIQSRGENWDFFEQKELETRATNQLAPGSSKGSRHIVEGAATVQFYKDGHPCAGGIIEAKGEWAVTHPEHANGKFGEGTFMFFYQMDARLEGEVRRVQD